MTDQLMSALIEHEGIRRFAYVDTTGHITVGVGRNISEDGEGLSTDEIFYILKNDISRLEKELIAFDWFRPLDEVRAGVIIEMAFNMGVHGVLGFHDVIENLKIQNFPPIPGQMAASEWARQISKSRLSNLQYRMRTGRYP